jgi:ribosomal-protein-alanine N-acetyltransferase
MLNVRNMTEADGQDVAKLEAEIFSDAWSEKSILDTLNQPQAFIVVAERENRIVGYCIVYFVLDEAEIARVAVDASQRQQGVGQELLKATCQICIEKGIERLLLAVRESNENARRFYQAFGFEVDGIRKNFYENPKEHAVLMSMSIV